MTNHCNIELMIIMQHVLCELDGNFNECDIQRVFNSLQKYDGLNTKSLITLLHDNVLFTPKAIDVFYSSVRDAVLVRQWAFVFVGGNPVMLSLINKLQSALLKEQISALPISTLPHTKHGITTLTKGKEANA